MKVSKNNLRAIDTTKNPIKYPETLKKIYEHNIIKKRKIFVDWIESISKKNLKNIEWWVLNPVSRHPHVSNLFHNFCLLESLKSFNKIANKKSTTLIVDNYIFNQLIGKKKRYIIKKKNVLIDFRKNFSNIFGFTKFIFIYLIIFLSVKIFKKKKIFNESILLADIFVTGNNFNGEHLYGKHFVKKANNKKNFYFVPIFSYASLVQTFKILFFLLRKDKYIFREEFLSFIDLLECCYSFFNRKKFKSNFKNLNNWNLSEIINKDISSFNSYYGSINGLINYKFAKNLSKKKVNVKKTINWFENQNLDKGWNLGFRSFFKNCDVIGYQGLAYFPEFFHLNPTVNEYEANVIPKKIIVISKIYKKIRKEFCSQLNIISGPALRFNTTNFKKTKKIKYKTLFILSGIQDYDTILLQNAIYLAKINPNLNFFIKCHPILPLTKIKDSKTMPNNIKQVFGNLDIILKSTENVVSAGPTSGILESLIYNCNLIIFKISIYDKILMNNLKIPKNLYKIVYNGFDLNKNLKKNEKNSNNKFKSIKSLLFEPTSQKNLSIFFN